MKNNLQEIINQPSAGKEIRLPAGEFEGPFYIKKPGIIIGDSTTLWSKDGPTLIVESHGVTLKDLRIERTDEPRLQADFNCIMTNAKDTVYENVQIIGNVAGVENESSGWEIPKIVQLGEFKADSKNTFFLEVNVPVKVSVRCTLTDIIVMPTQLLPGLNKITIITEKLKEHTFLYGEILFESAFIRRIYLSGKAVANITNYSDQKVVFKASNNKPIPSVVVTAKNIIAPMVSDPNIIILKKGQRSLVKDDLGNIIQIALSYESMLQPMEIDPYAFLLDAKDKATDDNKLIFFGNQTSECGEVNYIEKCEDKSIVIDFNKVSEKVSKISVAYSIYGDNPNHNFSKIIAPTIRILVSGKEKMRYSPNDLLVETTIVAVEFYRYKNEWKISTVGAGYREGLKRLCESFGLSVSS